MFTGVASAAPGHPTVAAVAPSYRYLDELTEYMINHEAAERPQTIRRVKEELLRRGNEFVALQRLDATRRAVVPAFSTDDPLNGRDVTITGDIDYDPALHALRIGLEPEPPSRWWHALGVSAQFNSFGSLRPDNVGFANGKALIPADASSAEQALGLFRQWVTKANRQYKQNLADEARKKEDQERERLAQERQQAEERVKILERLRRMPQS
jgi:hypothetical protein